MSKLDALKLKKLADYVLGYRLANYGYDRKDFAKLQREKTKNFGKLKLMLQVAPRVVLLNAACESRLQWYGVSSTWDYVVGQSANEEYIRLAARLARLHVLEAWQVLESNPND